MNLLIAVHDMFNWLTVLILLPLEAATGYLYYITKPMVSSLSNVQETGRPQFLKVITDPLTDLIIKVCILSSLFSSNCRVYSPGTLDCRCPASLRLEYGGQRR